MSLQQPINMNILGGKTCQNQIEKNSNFEIPFFYPYYVKNNNSYIITLCIFLERKLFNRFCGVMLSVLASIAVERGFKSRSCQTKDYKIGICCFSAKHTALRRKIWLARNRNNVVRVERHVYPLIVVSVNQHYKNPTQRVGLVQSGPHHHLIEN